MIFHKLRSSTLTFGASVNCAGDLAEVERRKDALVFFERLIADVNYF
jgi:hypothetical protein